MDPLFRARYPEDVWQQLGEDVPEVQEGDLAAIATPMDFLGINYYSRACGQRQRRRWTSPRPAASR
jgi:beta-glucosidase